MKNQNGQSQNQFFGFFVLKKIRGTSVPPLPLLLSVKIYGFIFTDLIIFTSK